jgi:lipoyl(octanoyl) transferase
VKRIEVINLGRTDYKECWDLQRRLVAQRAADEVGDLLLLTEHEHVYTIGKTGSDNHLLAGEEELRSKGIAVYHNDRGGDITYHGPGQLVGYPILDLGSYYLDLHRYLRDIEEVVIRTLASFGLKGERNAKYTGVWIGNNKICAIGVKTIRWITMHGFALNVNTDLSYFEHIVPCGIRGKGVTSLRRELGNDVELSEAANTMAVQFGSVFGRDVVQAPREENQSCTMHFDLPVLTGQ